jgi:hypothetical protein
MYRATLFAREDANDHFQIGRLKTLCYSQPAFCGLLQCQNTLKDLELIQSCCCRDGSALGSYSADASFLPTLTELRAGSRLVAALVLNRPIDSVHIMNIEYHQGSLQLAKLVSTLCMPSVPLILILFQYRDPHDYCVRQTRDAYPSEF